ncbi:Hydroxyacyl-thioester dehydratase type 2, mitochondrial [Trichoplax sp. H2]|nr:Hydroxyacyl-thioester dehydratase type 2, mitochondrial [Trichoplax sp. H2]|eukprot:RDD39362.1 Hydroxyacyl-thioester dehydratase type 2, mitochondrial [Trichoplax sp. H2]
MRLRSLSHALRVGWLNYGHGWLFYGNSPWIRYNSTTGHKVACIEDLSIGQSVEITRSFSHNDVKLFAQLSGDNNPLHLDPDYAKNTQFGRCIVHGLLINGLLSALLGTKLPGYGTIYVSQDIRFHSPLYIDEEVTALVQISNIRRSTVYAALTCTAKERNEVVLSGQAIVMIPKRNQIQSE